MSGFAGKNLFSRCRLSVECSARIKSHNRVIATIGKHIVAQQSLAGGYKSIGVDESTDLGIVITGLEVVELGFSVVNITRVRFGT